jgi:hypothetical protein
MKCMLTEIYSFSEFGCIDVQPRTFSDVVALYSSDMTPVYSGGLIYEYSWEGIARPNTQAGFGIVEIKGNSVNERPDFAALQIAFQKAPIPSGNGGYRPDNKASACPSESTSWKANQSIPAIPQGAIKFMSKGAGSAPGLNGGGSQSKGSPSTGSWIPIQESGGNDLKSKPSEKSGASTILVSICSFVPLVGIGLYFL